MEKMAAQEGSFNYGITPWLSASLDAKAQILRTSQKSSRRPFESHKDSSSMEDTLVAAQHIGRKACCLSGKMGHHASV